MECLKVLVIVGLAVALAHGEESSDVAYIECIKNLDTSCLKINLVRDIDRYARRRYMNWWNIVEFERNDNRSLVAPEGSNKGEADEPIESFNEADLPRSSEAKEQYLDALIANRIVKFVSDHIVRLRLGSLLPGMYLRVARSRASPQSSFDVTLLEDGSEVEGRGEGGGGLGGKGGGLGGKGKKGNRYILLFFLMQKLFLAKLAYLALKLLAFKALAVGKLSLVLSSVLWLKKIFAHKHSTHYTVVPHTHHEEHFEPSHDHWASGTTHYEGKGEDGYAYYNGGESYGSEDYKTGRSLDGSKDRELEESAREMDSQEMAYRGQFAKIQESQ